VETILTLAIGFLVPVVEACGAVIVVLEVVRTVAGYVSTLLRHNPVRMNTLRLRLGQSLVMGLEFQVAADILKTTLAPTWNDMGLLAALIGVRTVLNYLLEREVRMLRAEEASSCLYATGAEGSQGQRGDESSDREGVVE
jgi:uncharacterized membrane protein